VGLAAELRVLERQELGVTMRDDFSNTVGVHRDSGHGLTAYTLVGSSEHLREFLTALQEGLERPPQREMVDVLVPKGHAPKRVEVKLPQVSLLAEDLAGSGRLAVQIAVDVDLEEWRRRPAFEGPAVLVAMGVTLLLAVVGFHTVVAALVERVFGPR
jgi:hypothetical protein